MLRQLAITRGTAPNLDKRALYAEVTEFSSNSLQDGESPNGGEKVLDKKALVTFLQMNGCCFP